MKRTAITTPQTIAAAAVAPGVTANLRFPERPGRIYPAQVVRTAEAIDPNSRTLQVELMEDNSNGELFPGAYIQVHFDLAHAAESLRVPANAVLFRSTDLQVAVVGADHRVKLKNISDDNLVAHNCEYN